MNGPQLQLSDINLVTTLWDYMHLQQVILKADIIVGLGSHDLCVARHAASLYHEGYASLVIFSGNVGRLTEGAFNEPEAVIMKREAVKLGVPDDA